MALQSIENLFIKNCNVYIGKKTKSSLTEELFVPRIYIMVTKYVYDVHLTLSLNYILSI